MTEGKDGIDRTKNKFGRTDEGYVGYHFSGYTRPQQVDAVIQSPPYQEGAKGRGDTSEELTNGPFRGRSYRPGDMYGNGENIGNLRSEAYWSEISKVYAECWRILQKRKSPDTFDDRLNFEEVVCMRKPARPEPVEGRGVAVVLTSPPYEGSLQGDEPKGKLFETERRVNSPASGNRRSKRKSLGYGYSK